MSVEEQAQHEQRSLYRRHRPRSFDEVVGQEAVVRTLRNAVQQDRVHHAYLFVGSRGTGKTSMAKILAACLNCEQGPTVQPCGVCQSCVAIARASSLDVIEMDAASNNSVDDIRELRESVAYAPVSGRRKVYILDEAHMLSTAAWNAFLKTLEEPPPSTIFVLATTEAAKVPATVVDRCHRFDFQRPTVEQIASVVQRVAAAESVEIPPAAVAALARAATGSFRDALGTLEQLVTYSGSPIALEDVLAVLGVADATLISEMIDAAAQGEVARALRALEQCVEQGRDAASVTRDLEVRARELLLVQSLREVPAEISLTPEADSELLSQAERCPPATIVRLLELLGEAVEGIRAGADPRTRLELALVKAARPAVDGSPRALLARIERLEAQPAHVGAGRAPAHVHAEHARQAAPAAASQAPRAERAPPAEGAGAVDAGVDEPAGVEAPAGADANSGIGSGPHTDVGTDAGTGGGAGADAPTDAGTGPRSGELGELSALWPEVVELVRAEHALLGALIAEAQPVRVEGDRLTLAFGSTAQFLRKKAEERANRAVVSEALRALTGARWQLSYELREVSSGHPAAGAEDQSEEELVRRFIEEFDAEEVPGDWQEVRTDEEAGDQGQPVEQRIASGNEGAG